MAEFKQVVITHKGQALMSKLMSGTGTAEFTAIKISDVSYTDDQLEGLSSLGNIKQVVPISKVTRTNDVAVQVEGAISNTDLKAGYYMRTLGLFANDPNKGEILYAVTSASQAGYMPPYNGRTTSGAFFRLVTTIGNANNITLQVNPSAVATIGDIQDLQEQLNDLKGIIGYTDDDIFGLEADFENNKFTRLAGAKNRTPGASFDNLGPWKRRRCILAEDGTVLAYEGESGYITTGELKQEIKVGKNTYPVGTRVNVMVEQPKFYYRVVPLKIVSKDGCNQILKKARYYVTSTPHEGFSVHPAFISSGGAVTERIYLSAYDSSTYVIKNLGGAEGVNKEVLTSVAGQFPKQSSVDDFRILKNQIYSDFRGIKVGTYNLAESTTYAMSQLLFIIEYGGFNSRHLLGAGVTQSVFVKTGLGDEKPTSSSAAKEDWPIVYRGEENLWGNTNKLIPDLIARQSDHKLVVQTENTSGDDYRFTINSSRTFGTASCFLYAASTDWLFFPYNDNSPENLMIDSDLFYSEKDGLYTGVWGVNSARGKSLFDLDLSLDKDRVGNIRMTCYPVTQY